MPRYLLGQHAYFIRAGHWPRGARAASHAHQAVLRLLDRVRRAAEYPCLPDVFGFAGCAAGFEWRSGEASRCVRRSRSVARSEITSRFARKNYFYPDLPKGYQISQFDAPFSDDGFLDIEIGEGENKITRHARIQRVHMEEDAGKNFHDKGDESIVDLNRSGTPLIEIVGHPDLRSGAEAAEYLRTLRDILVFLGVNDGNLEEGSFRCDANVSIRPVGTETLGTRTELKNINSFKFVEKAIAHEISRQISVLDGGARIVQETRGWNEKDSKTYSLRSKETAQDYRYFSRARSSAAFDR